MALDMKELYWLSLARDVPYRAYAESPLIQQAAVDLGTEAKGVFRGPTTGDRNGPYISQFLVRPVETVSTVFEQRYRTPSPGTDFMSSSPAAATGGSDLFASSTR